MEFKNREEMIEFEEKRTDYYMESINAIDQGRIFTFYRLWLREIFIPKYRKLKKLYDSYNGGWYRDEDGYIHASYPHLVETNNLLDGEILIADYGGFDNIPSDIYFLKNKTWIKMASPDALKKILEEKGFPTLILDGDGCSRQNANDGQAVTRMEAFLELLEKRK